MSQFQAIDHSTELGKKNLILACLFTVGL